MTGTGRNRSEAMAARLLSPTAADDAPAHAVPNWLVAEQDAHKRPDVAAAPTRTGTAKVAAGSDSGGGGPGGSGTGGQGASIGDAEEAAAARARARSKATVKAKVKTRAEGDVAVANASVAASKGHLRSGEDFLMLDMLEAAHVPGAEAGGLPAAGASGGAVMVSGESAVSGGEGAGRNVSAEADSILSLPPLDEGSATRWHTRKAAAQEARAHARRASFAGAAAVAAPGSVLPARSPPRKPRMSTAGSSGHALGAAVGMEPSPGRPPGLAPAAMAMPPVEKVGGGAGDSAALPRSGPERPMGRDASEASLTSSVAASDASGKACRAAASVRSKHSHSHSHSHSRSRGHHRRRSVAVPDAFEGRSRESERREAGPDDESCETRRAARRRLAQRNAAVSSAVYPHSWEWRRPADEDVIIPSGAWIYLAVIGWCSFACAYIINLCAKLLSGEVTDTLSFLGVAMFGEGSRRYVLASLRATFLVAAFLITTVLSPKFTAGSGIPEMKCVLSGVFMPAALSEWTLAAKVIGLIFSLASSVSIGRLGPFIHISGICAALVSKTGWFPVLTSSARFQLQAVSSAMAAGVGATFGAPIGGTMLAIELMSTYYYIHWMPMALYCSIMGYYLVAAVAPTDAESYFSATIAIGRDNESLYKIVTYVLLGCICGVVGALLVQYTVFMWQLQRRFLRRETIVRTSIFLAAFAVTHSLVVFHFGGVLEQNQRAGVSSLFNEKSTKTWIRHSAEALKATPDPKDNSWSTPLSLFYATFIKFLLTGVSLVLPVPAGTFMPIFEIGALLGRGFGELFFRFKWVTWIDPRATAIVGAAGVTAGSLHITSIAVVMLEITHDAVDILPLALGVIFAYGVSKHLCSDLFSELIKARRLPFILGLRERYPQENKTFYERVASVSAGTFMTREFALVTPASTVGEVRKLLGVEGTQKYGAWRVCAFLNNATDRHLYGVIPRAVLAEAVKDPSTNAPSPGPVLPKPLSANRQFGSSGRIGPLLPVMNAQSREAGPAGYGSFHDGLGDRDRNYSSVASTKLSENAFLPMLAEYDRNYGHRSIDMGPMQVSIQTPFWKVATYFRMLGMNSIYVTQDGATVGLLTKAQVINYTFEEEDKALAERLQSAQEAREVAEMTAIVAGRISTGRASTAAGSKVRLASRFSQSDLESMAAHRVRGAPGRSSGHILQTS